jgi:LacI family transcriptional regulator
LSNIQVPEDVAVIGVDNDEMICRLATPPLSSVQQGTWRLGYEAAKLLGQMMAGKKAPKHKYVIEPEGIVSRRSTDSLAIEDADVARAMRFIDEHASEGIKVPDVVEAVGGGRSTIERRFEAVMGRTIRAEIRRVQLERAKDLIASTDLPLKQIAATTGFGSIQHMTTLFRQQVGRTPAKYRRRATL